MRWLVVALVACTTTDPVEPQVTSGVEIKSIPLYRSKKLDLLLVIDNTPAMAQYQNALRTNLRTFADDLRDTELHLGVITADPGDASAWHTAGLVDHILTDEIGPDGERVRNYAGDLADAMVALGDVGMAGARSSPLATASRVFEHPRDGFQRPYALGATVIITAGDLPDPSNDLFVALFDSFFGNGFFRFLAVHGPGDRLPAFLDHFQGSRRAPISGDDWSSALHIERLVHPAGTPCLEGPLFDSDPLVPDIQEVCSVWYEFPIGGAVVPPCRDAPARECWRTLPDRLRCPEDGWRSFEIEHQRSDFPEGAMLRIECLTTTQQI